MVMPNLLLQKLSQNSKAKDHLTALERMQSWLKGDLNGALAWGTDNTEELNATINERRCSKDFEEVCSFIEERKGKSCY